MKRKNILKAHIIATILAGLSILAFFSSSLLAEIRGDIAFIKLVKTCILYAIPIMIIAMPILKITGDTLAGKSKNPMVLMKKKRMKLILVNGVALISLAVFLYYRAHFHSIDEVFLIGQIIEFGFGLVNLILIVLNTRAGLQISGYLNKSL